MTETNYLIFKYENSYAFGSCSIYPKLLYPKSLKEYVFDSSLYGTVYINRLVLLTRPGQKDDSEVFHGPKCYVLYGTWLT